MSEYIGAPVFASGTTRSWTKAHRREALRRIYELAAQLVGEGVAATRVEYLLTFARKCSKSESEFEDMLANMLISRKRARREVQHVRDLAEGRRVRMESKRFVIRGSGSDLYVHRDGGWTSRDLARSCTARAEANVVAKSYDAGNAVVVPVRVRIIGARKVGVSGGV